MIPFDGVLRIHRMGDTWLGIPLSRAPMRGWGAFWDRELFMLPCYALGYIQPAFASSGGWPGARQISSIFMEAVSFLHNMSHLFLSI